MAPSEPNATEPNASAPNASDPRSGTERLHGDALRADPRIAQARRLIGEAVREHRAALHETRDPRPELASAYETLLQRLTLTRGAPPLWPYLSAGIGNGPYVELADGSVKLDFIGGIGVHGCGHSDDRMVDAAIDAALEDTVMQGNLQQHPPSIRMGERLIELASVGGAPLSTCLLSTSGAMANENALKIAFHHRAPATRILAFDNAFAGRSLALASLTDRAAYRSGLPVTLAVDYLPFRDPAEPARSQRWAVDELHRLLRRHPERYAAFWAEPIAGEGGYYPGSHDFFTALARPLRDAGIPIIFDEVQSFSRTTRPFAFQHYGLDQFADIVTVGKITQVCATLYRDSMRPSAPILSQTFTGSSSSIATGLAMLDALESAGCFGPDGKNARLHETFAAGLSRLADKYPGMVHGPYGEGMMIAFTPANGAPAEAKRLMEIMYRRGLLGFICGGNPTRVRFLPPPAVTTAEHVDAALQLLDDSIAEFARSTPSSPAG